MYIQIHISDQLCFGAPDLVIYIYHIWRSLLWLCWAQGGNKIPQKMNLLPLKERFWDIILKGKGKGKGNDVLCIFGQKEIMSSERHWCFQLYVLIFESFSLSKGKPMICMLCLGRLNTKTLGYGLMDLIQWLPTHHTMQNIKKATQIVWPPNDNLTPKRLGYAMNLRSDFAVVLTVISGFLNEFDPEFAWMAPPSGTPHRPSCQ